MFMKFRCDLKNTLDPLCKVGQQNLLILKRTLACYKLLLLINTACIYKNITPLIMLVKLTSFAIQLDLFIRKCGTNVDFYYLH